MLSLFLSILLTDHTPYHWHMSCSRFMARQAEIMMDENLDINSKLSLIRYLRSKVPGKCEEKLALDANVD